MPLAGHNCAISRHFAGISILRNSFFLKQYVDNRSLIALRLQNQSYPEYIYMVSAN